MAWARITNGTVHEVWERKPVLHSALMADVVERTLAELVAMGWQLPRAPDQPPNAKQRLEREADASPLFSALLTREQSGRGLSKSQLFDELESFLS